MRSVGKDAAIGRRKDKDAVVNHKNTAATKKCRGYFIKIMKFVEKSIEKNLRIVYNREDKRMNRKYTIEEYKEKCDMIRSYYDRPAITTDVIVGFPGETDALFQETLDLVRETRPIKIHAFPFSPRPGTPAAIMPEQVNRAISKERVRIINDLANKNRTEFMQAQVGKTVQVLIEENNVARCPHDIGVKVGGCAVSARTICNVLLTDIDGDNFVGHVH